MSRDDLNHDFWRLVNALVLAKAAQPGLRVGQLLSIAVSNDLYFVGDEAMATLLEKYVGTQNGARR